MIYGLSLKSRKSSVNDKDPMNYFERTTYQDIYIYIYIIYTGKSCKLINTEVL